MYLINQLIECFHIFIILNYLVCFLPPAVILRGFCKITENLKFSCKPRAVWSNTIFLFLSVPVCVSAVVPSQEKAIFYFARLKWADTDGSWSVFQLFCRAGDFREAGHVSSRIWNSGIVLSLNTQVAHTLLEQLVCPFFCCFFFFSPSINVLVLFPDKEWRRGAAL